MQLVKCLKYPLGSSTVHIRRISNFFVPSASGTTRACVISAPYCCCQAPLFFGTDSSSLRLLHCSRLQFRMLATSRPLVIMELSLTMLAASNPCSEESCSFSASMQTSIVVKIAGGEMVAAKAIRNFTFAMWYAINAQPICFFVNTVIIDSDSDGNRICTCQHNSAWMAIPFFLLPTFQSS
jgi:hypothetical protein